MIPQGQRNNILASIAGAARRRGTSQEGIEALLLAENRARCRPPLTNDEVRTIAGSIASYPPGQGPTALLKTEDGKLRPILANVIAMLRNDPAWAGVLGFDEFAGRVVIRRDAPGFPADTRPYPQAWTDEMDAYTLTWMQRAGVLFSSLNGIASAVKAVASEKQNRFHPVRDYLEGLVWDGVERCDHWLEICFAAKDSDFIRAVSRCWLISACARVFTPGSQADYTLLLLGRQGVGKSSGLRALVPNDEWFSDSLSLVGTKDSRLELRSKWIVELPELSAMKRAEIETVKAFLSERTDHYREPYARHASDVPRQNIFSASSNELTPLLDSENRRFWPVRVGKVDVAALEASRDQLWAEAYHYFKRGDCWWLESEQLQQSAAEEQKQAYSPDSWTERISEWIENPTQRYGGDEALPWAESEKGKINIGDVLGHCIGLKFSEWERSGGAAAKSVGRTLRHLGYHAMQQGSGPHRGKRYYIKGETE